MQCSHGIRLSGPGKQCGKSGKSGRNDTHVIRPYLYEKSKTDKSIEIRLVTVGLRGGVGKDRLMGNWASS